MSIEWHIQPDVTASAQALADAVAEALQQTLAQKNQAVLAVSGGRSPIAFFQALSSKALDWHKISVTLLDERIVPIQHQDSNSELVQHYLLQNQAADATWLPLIDAQADAVELMDVQKAVNYALQNYRQPDVLVLGMGGDGHTASLFPEAPQLDLALDTNYTPPLLHITPITAPHERISMTLAVIEQTSRVFLAIAGAEKKAVLEQALAGMSKTHPISYVLHSEKMVTHVYFNY